jgi:hypothetical protein
MAAKAEKAVATVTPIASAVAVDRTKMNALAGTIDELMRAFDQIGANLVSLSLNGWDSVQKCKAACWLAHGAGMHPATFVQNHYCMILKGRLTVEPKWEFIVGALQSRLPGFRFEVLIETDDCAEVRMSEANGNEHTVRYTLADAKRQGLLSRDNAWAANPREMCFKQAVKRCGRRIGAAVLMDLPVGSDGYEVVAEQETRTTAAEAIDAAVARATKESAPVVDAAFEDAVEEAGADTPRSQGAEPEAQPPAPESGSERAAAPAETSRARLHTLMTRVYGRMTKAAEGERVTALYNAMMKEETGIDPGEDFTKGVKLGPVEADRMVAFLTSKLKSGGGGLQHDEPAPVRDRPESPSDPPPPETESAGRTVQDAFDELATTVHRARKLFGRKYIVEAPPGSAVFWFNDQATLSQAGDGNVSVKLQVGPDIVAPIEKLDQFNRLLSVSCDEKERGGR